MKTKSSLTFKTDLYAHQRQAIEKLSDVKVGALYMEMGTGKTRAAFELFAQRYNEGKVDCLLWLCPVSVKLTIANEVEKHFKEADYQLVDSDGFDKNKDIYIAGLESVSQSDAVTLILQRLVNNNNPFIVIDESSLIKNVEAKRSLRVWRFGENADYKLILSGTPVTNTEEDLFSQWYFLDKRILGYTSYYSFAANHLEFDPDYPDRVIGAHDTELLTKKMSPYMYQIRKDECLDLPSKTYSHRYFSMTREQSNIYYDIKQEMLMDVELEEFKSYTLFKLFTALQKVTSGLTNDNEKIFDKPKLNPRIQLLQEILNEIGNKKVIIWCKFHHEINAITEVLERKNVALYYGELNESERAKEMDKFKGDINYLIANKQVGGFGLNLQFCDTAVYYSNDFDWATRKQSEDRIHRIEQDKKVTLIDIICSNSIDTRIQKVLRKKTGLINSFKKQIDKFKNEEDLEEWLDNAKTISPKERV